jgi:hypothetical protein
MTWLRVRHVLLAVLVFGWEPVLAQPALSQSPQFQAESQQFQARLEEAARALGSNPRLKKVSEEKRRQLTEFVVGNMLFTTLHETAHGAIAEMGLPVLGREEDAADAFAVVTMLKVQTTLSHAVLVEAAKAWFLTDLRDRKEGDKPELYDAHGLDEQRAYQIVCLMVGSNKEQFKDLADMTNLPEERQETCQIDYQRASSSWEKVLQPNRRRPEQPKQQIEVTYGPGKGDFDIYEQTFRSVRLLETVADPAAERYVWPHPLGFEVAACGEINAQWQFRSRKLFLCYELAQDFAELYRDYGQRWNAPPKEKWWQLKWWKRAKKE